MPRPPKRRAKVHGGGRGGGKDVFKIYSNKLKVISKYIQITFRMHSNKFKTHSEHIQKALKTHSKNIQIHSKYIQNTFERHSKNIQKTFKKHSKYCLKFQKFLFCCAQKARKL